MQASVKRKKSAKLYLFKALGIITRYLANGDGVMIEKLFSAMGLSKLLKYVLRKLLTWIFNTSDEGHVVLDWRKASGKLS